MNGTTAAPAIEARDLCKFYGAFAAVRDVSFEIPQGQVVAFLGPNGAGKSTVMKMLTGFIAPTSGEARVLGHNVEVDRVEIARRVGYLPENGPLYTDMTPRSLLTFFGNARGLTGNRLEQRLAWVVEAFELGSVISKPIHKLSKGFKQRVGMAQATLHEPSVLIMDEPTSGLDPNQIHEVRQTIRDLGRTATVLLSTHVLQEVDAVAERVIMINEGRLVFDGPIEEFRRDGDMEARFSKLTGFKG
jgi:ABC-2 type transport system ATP-binding protein